MSNKNYLEFLQVQNPGKKTKIFHIFNRVTGEFIGRIKWSCGWRKYVSEIETCEKETMEFDEGCHRVVADFIKELMEERNESR